MTQRLGITQMERVKMLDAIEKGLTWGEFLKGTGGRKPLTHVDLAYVKKEYWDRFTSEDHKKRAKKRDAVGTAAEDHVEPRQGEGPGSNKGLDTPPDIAAERQRKAEEERKKKLGDKL